MGERWRWLLLGAGWLILLVPNSCVLDASGTLQPGVAGGGGGAAGSGGGAECITGADCPPASKECRVALCEQTICSEMFAPIGQVCEGDKICNHLGECVSDLGAVCAYGEDCYSGQCQDGFCCESACDGLCEACDLAGHEGSCTVVSSGMDPGQECALHCDGLGQCVSGDHMWSRTYGGWYNEIPRALATDSLGAVIFGAEIESSVTFGGATLVPKQNYDVAVVKLDAAGTHEWSLQFSGYNSEYVGALAVTPDDEVVVAGRFIEEMQIGGDFYDPPCCSSDLWVAKIDPTGVLLWSKAFTGNGSADVYSMVVDEAGDIYLGGYYDYQLDLGGTLLNGGSDQDGFLLKLYADGNYAWAVSLGDSQNQAVSGLALNEAGDLLVAGYYAGTIPELTFLPTANETDIFVAAVSADTHSELWSRAYGGVGVQRPLALSSAPENGMVIAGNFAGDLAFEGPNIPLVGATDIFVARLDDQGDALWSHSYGGSGDEFASGIAVDAAGNIVLVGAISAGVSFGGGVLPVSDAWDAFVAKLGPEGDHYWSHSHGNWYNDVTTAVANHPAGGVVAAGLFEWAIDFGTGSVDSAGYADTFVVRLTP